MYKYKLKEIEVGDTEIRGGVKSTVTDINPTTGAISWDIVDTADFSSVYKALEKAKRFLDDLDNKSEQTKSDPIIDKLAADIADLFNEFRTHVRKKYPEDYERVKRLKENALRNPETKDVYEKGDTIIYRKDDIARSGKIELRTKDFDYYVNDDSDSKGYIVKKEDIIGLNLEEGDVEEISTSGAAGSYLTPYAFRLKGSKPNDKAYKELGYKEVKENIGATLGPGPKAGSDGVKDSAYVKQFKYKLVPKKIKGSGLEVKQLFEDDTPQAKFQKERVDAFKVIEKELNDIYKMISNAKDETLDYYKDNPSSYAIVKSTDLIIDYLRDIKSLLKTQ
jgi:uncharacterized protein YfcZ (UPF0381/DUF406 family)